MAHSTPTVLIVDRSSFSACDLRTSFIAAGANIHVVSNFQVAAKLLATKVIDAALVEYSTDSETVGFVEALAALEVPCIFISAQEPKYVRTHKLQLPADVTQALSELVAVKQTMKTRRLFK